MILSKLHKSFLQELTPYYPREERQSFFKILALYYLQLDRAQIVIQGDLVLSEEMIKIFRSAQLRLKKYEPIQYILGETEFYGLRLNVTPATLIPRPETEQLVDWIVKDYKSAQSPKLIDLCTGSGCIVLALTKNLNDATSYAIDVSQEALEVARQNASQHKVVVDFIKEDLLQKTPSNGPFDIIVSNPPYVRNLEKQAMQPNVLKHEPELALFVDDNDPLLFYRIIAAFAKNNLTAKGALYLEINEYLSKETCSLLGQNGFNNIELRVDIFGKNRMIKCW